MTTEIQIEQTEKYKAWEKRLKSLDEMINDLTEWNDYAEMLQSRYDEMLREDPRLEK